MGNPLVWGPGSSDLGDVYGPVRGSVSHVGRVLCVWRASRSAPRSGWLARVLDEEGACASPTQAVRGAVSAG